MFVCDLLEELTAPRELTNEPMVTTPSPILVSKSVWTLCVCMYVYEYVCLYVHTCVNRLANPHMILYTHKSMRACLCNTDRLQAILDCRKIRR